MSLDQARGASDPSGDPGWFFVIQEQPSEPRFGFDMPDGTGGTAGSIKDLTWSEVVPSGLTIDALDYIDLDAVEPTAAEAYWNKTAALMAFVTLQQPVRVAVHGSLLLGGELQAS